MRTRRWFLLAILIAASGCETLAPWERDLLARPDMQLETDPLSGKLAAQVYDSKEAASGGVAPAGAGCGCN